MDTQARDLASFVVASLLANKPASDRLLIGIYGIPASGKTTFAALLLKYTNALLENHAAAKAILVSLDGWHLTRAQLDQFPDPKLARDRRGIHWTFDADGYLSFVEQLRHSDSEIITAPSFDHAIKDPSPDAIRILPIHRIVIIEGLYTALKIDDAWFKAAHLLDERWLIQLPIESAQERLIKRHVISGVAKDEEEAVWRAKENDMPNGRFLLANSLEPTRVIPSVEDPVFTLS